MVTVGALQKGGRIDPGSYPQVVGIRFVSGRSGHPGTQQSIRLGSQLVLDRFSAPPPGEARAGPLDGRFLAYPFKDADVDGNGMFDFQEFMKTHISRMGS